jgi:uncharacterized protein YlzI (FlbEa/FlbD family)
MLIELHYWNHAISVNHDHMGEAFFVNPKYIKCVEPAYRYRSDVLPDTACVHIDGDKFFNICFESVSEVMEKIQELENRNGQHQRKADL